MPTDNHSEQLATAMEQGNELAQLEYGADAGEPDVRLPALRPIEVAWLLWSKRKFLRRLAWIGLVVSTVIAFLIPKQYEATAQLMPPDFSSSSSALAAVLPAMGGSADASSVGGAGVMGLANKLLGLNSPGQLMIGVLRSRTISDALIERFKLADLYETSYPEDTRKALAGYTSIDEDDKTGIISIAVLDKSPERASAMAQAYTEELNRVLAQVNSSSAHRERVFIEQRLQEVKRDLDESSKEFSQFASQNAAVDITEQAKAMVSAAADLQAQLIAAQSMLKGLQQIYTESNPRVRQAQAQVAELQEQLTKMGGKGAVTGDGSTLPKDALYPTIRQLPLLGVKYLDLYRRTQINEAVFELLSKEYEVIKIEEARNTPTVQVLDQSVVPEKKAKPHRLILIVAGTGFFLCCGMTWIVGLAMWDQTDPRNPWKEFSQEVISATWNSPRWRAFRAKFRRKPRTPGPDAGSDSEGSQS